MANPTDVGIDDYVPGLIVTDNSEVAVTLDYKKSYTLWHSGFDGTGAGSADTSVVYLTFNTTASSSATTAGSANKALLVSGQELHIGPGLTEVSTITGNASNEPAVTIVPHVSTQGHQ